MWTYRLQSAPECCWGSAAARLAQSVERKALNLVVVGSSPTVGALSERVGPRCCMRGRVRALLHLLAARVASVAWSRVQGSGLVSRAYGLDLEPR